MMGRNGILAQDVIAIAEQLVSKGDIPTIEKVRVILGTGSNSTIAKHLTEWKTSRLKADYKDIIANYAAPDPVNQAVAKVWQQLQDENQAKLEGLEQQAAEKIHVALEQKEAAVKYSEQLLTDNQDLRALLQTTRQQNEALTDNNAELKEKCIALDAKLAISEKAHQEFKQWAEETRKSLEEKYSHSIQQYETQQSINQSKYEKELDTMKGLAEEQRHRHIVEIDHLKTAIQKLQTQLAEKDKMIMELNNRVGQLSTRAISKNNELEELIFKKIFVEKDFSKNYQDYFLKFKNEFTIIWEKKFDNLSKNLITELFSNKIINDKQPEKVPENESVT